MSKRTKKKLLSFIIVFILAAAGYLGGEVKNPDIVQPRSNISQNTNTESIEETNRDLSTKATTSFDLSSIPDFNGCLPILSRSRIPTNPIAVCCGLPIHIVGIS